MNSTTDMAKKKKEKKGTEGEFLFGRKNYLIMLAGIVVILVGFALMAGGGSDDPEVFNEAIYSFRRIRLAPAIVLLGLAIEVYAIMANPNASND